MGKKDNKLQSGIKGSGVTALPESRWPMVLAILACIALPFIIYSNSLHAPFIFDDIVYITENPRIKQLSLTFGPGSSTGDLEQQVVGKMESFRGLTFLTLALNYRWDGPKPFGYHLFNVVAHILNTLLIFFLMRKILLLASAPSGVTSFDSQKPVYGEITICALLAALTFSSHPMNTEVVSYISHRSDSLATFFYLSSILLWLKALEKGKTLLVVSVLMFALSFLSKEIAATLPALLIIFDYIFLSDFQVSKVYSKKFCHLPYWALLGVFLTIRYLYLGGVKDFSDVTYLRWSQLTYVLVQPQVILKYIKLLLVPMGQCIDHFILPPEKLYDMKVMLSWFTVIPICGIAVWLFKKRSPLSKLALFSILWFLVALSPTSVLPINDAMAERRVYLPGLGFYLGLLSFYLWLFKITPWAPSKDSSRDKRSLFIFVLGVHILLLSVATWKRNIKYRNPVLLWQDAIALYPKNDRAYYNLGVLLNDAKNYANALNQFQKAIQNNPNNDRAYYNLGVLFNDQKASEKARELFQKAIQLNPYHAKAYSNLALIYATERKYGQALQLFQKAVILNPNDAKSYNNMGSIYVTLGDYAKAEQMFLKSMQIDPTFQEAIFNVGQLYLNLRRYEKAMISFQRTIELNPNDFEAYNNVGLIYARQKDYGKAVKFFEKAVELNPNFVDAQNNLRLTNKILKIS